MRLSYVLSKPPQKEYTQVDGFLQGKKGNIGQQVNLEVGNIALNYFCSECDDLRTYYLNGNCDEELGLQKYEALNKLVIGILENIINKEELKGALIESGIDSGGENE